MHVVTILIIALASNLDNLGIGVSFGIRSTKIPLISNLIIAVISMFAAYLSIALGSLVTLYIPHYLANWAGGLIIILIGFHSLLTTFLQARQKQPEPVGPEHRDGSIMQILQEPGIADKDHNQLISWQESVLLGFALAINCVATGFGAGVSSISPIWTTLAIGAFSLITVDIGIRAGYRMSSMWIGKYSNLIAGAMLIMIGCYEIFV